MWDAVMNRNSLKPGFTLMELIVTIAVSAIFMVAFHYVWTNIIKNSKKQQAQLQEMSELKHISIRLQAELRRSYSINCDTQEWTSRDGQTHATSSLVPGDQNETQISFECLRNNGRYLGTIKRFSDKVPTQIVWRIPGDVVVFQGSVWLAGLEE